MSSIGQVNFRKSLAQDINSNGPMDFANAESSLGKNASGLISFGNSKRHFSVNYNGVEPNFKT